MDNLWKLTHALLKSGAIIKEVTMRWKKSRFPDEIGERYEEIEYRGGKVLQRWRGSGGNVRLSHLLMSFW